MTGCSDGHSIGLNTTCTNLGSSCSVPAPFLDIKATQEDPGKGAVGLGISTVHPEIWDEGC